MKYVAVQFGNPHGYAGLTATFIMNCLNKRLYHMVEKKLSIKPEERVLDIGFGNGYVLQMINRKHPSTPLYGIDISEDMLQAATQRNIQAVTEGKIKLSVGNVMELPFKNQAFDKVYTVNTLYFWPDPDKGLQEIRRIMKPDALFLLVGNYKEWLDKLPITKHNFKKYDIKEIETLIERNELLLVESICIEKKKSYCLIIKRNNKHEN